MPHSDDVERELEAGRDAIAANKQLALHYYAAEKAQLEARVESLCLKIHWAASRLEQPFNLFKNRAYRLSRMDVAQYLREVLAAEHAIQPKLRTNKRNGGDEND